MSFSLSHTPNGPLSGASLFDAYFLCTTICSIFDFGISSINGEPIKAQLIEAFPATMELCALALSFALLIGIPAGSSRVWRNKPADTFISHLALWAFQPGLWSCIITTPFH